MKSKHRRVLVYVSCTIGKPLQAGAMGLTLRKTSRGSGFDVRGTKADVSLVQHYVVTVQRFAEVGNTLTGRRLQ